MNRNDLGKYAEILVARVFGYDRVKASGAVWPHKEDLIRKEWSGGPSDNDGHYVYTDIAQVKGHAASDLKPTGFLKDYLTLRRHAAVRTSRGAHSWYDVYVTPRKVYVFRTEMVREMDRGVGGDAP